VQAERGRKPPQQRRARRPAAEQAQQFGLGHLGEPGQGADVQSLVIRRPLQQRTALLSPCHLSGRAWSSDHTPISGRPATTAVGDGVGTGVATR
jgi:hypothetical protein